MQAIVSNMLKRVVVFIAVFVCLLTPLLPLAAASALSGSEFNAANITDDTVFFNKYGMSTNDIQAFLNSKVPVCDTNHAANGSNVPPFTCLKDFRQSVPGINPDAYCSGSSVAGTKSAAQIITDVSMACSINPKVLIVLLQKEQALVTDTWPWDAQYRSATGYGCPDTAACDSTYYGFFNQVYNAARQLQRYTKQPQNFSFAAGRVSFIPYQANRPDCSGSNIGLYNSATAALYNYTPYQPNAAALANLYGTGDGCSAYGNRNFWRLFNDWFGSTRTVISSQPATVTSGPGLINIFARATDGRLLERWYDSNGWNTIYNNIGGSYLNSPPAAVSLGNGHKDLFETTSDGSVRHRYYLPDATGWRPWEDLGHPFGIPLATQPSVVSKAPGKINLFVKGTDGRLWEKWYENGQWVSTWNNVGGSTISSAPAAMTLGNGHVDLFETTSDGNIRHRYYSPDAIGWRGWEDLGHPFGIPLASAPAVISKAPNKINIFVKGTDGRLWEKWFDNGQWVNTWNNIGGSYINSAPAAVSLGGGHVDLFETTSDGSIRHRYYLPDATGWRDWEYL